MATTRSTTTTRKDTISNHLQFRLATPDDAEHLETLINSAFSADQTTDIYLSPDHRKIGLASVESINNTLRLFPETVVFVGVDPNTGAVVGHFSLRRSVGTLSGRREFGKHTDTPAAAGDVPTFGSLGTRVTAWFGLLAVSPSQQSRGWGGQLVEHAERYARREWSASRMEFDVVNTRGKLRKWYERRGYEPTGETRPFAYDRHPGWEGVLREGLEFVVMGKDL